MFSCFENFRVRAFSIHLLISALVAILVASIIFFVWYPYPYREISGGAELFWMIVSIDVILGPLMTLVVSRPGKSFRALRFDYVVIAALQLGALGYGTWTMAQARPVHMVWENDLFRVAHVSDILPDQALFAPDGIKPYPWTGPDIIAIKLPEKGKDKEKILFDTLDSGVFEAYNPKLWVSYEKVHDNVVKSATPLRVILQDHPDFREQAEQILQKNGKSEDDIVCALLVGRNFTEWTVLLDKSDVLPIGYFQASLVKREENPASSSHKKE